MNDDVCQHCGGPLRFLEKDTSSGREYREYRCEKCGEMVTLGGDVALWKVLHDDAEERRARQATAYDPEPMNPPVPKPWWKFWG